MSLANAIRASLVIGWLVLFGNHALHYALPDLGLQDRHDFAAVVNANLDREFTYQLLPEQGPGMHHPMGTCTLSLTRDESRFLLTTELRLTDHAIDVMLDALLPQMQNSTHDKSLRLTVKETLDEHLHLDEVQATGSAHGHSVSATGHVGATGLAGTWSLDDTSPTPYLLPEITPLTTQGLDVAISLPPGLSPGDRFTSHMVNPDLLKLSAHRAIAVFQVRGREAVRTLHGELELLRVDLEVDGKPYSSLWCDASGTVYRSVQSGSHLALMLDRKSDTYKGLPIVIWPASP